MSIETTEIRNAKIGIFPGLIKPRVRSSKKSQAPAADGRKISHLRGFGPMTRISTNFGEVPAQTLRVGDVVRTRSGSFMEIVWLDRIILSESFLQYHPRALPIVLYAGSLGRNLPSNDIMLAPFQAISSDQTFSGRQPSNALDALDRPSVVRRAEPMITYTVFHCGRPTSVKAEGVWMDVSP